MDGYFYGKTLKVLETFGASYFNGHAFEFSSVSKKSHRVEIRLLDKLQNSCTHP